MRYSTAWQASIAVKWPRHSPECSGRAAATNLNSHMICKQITEATSGCSPLLWVCSRKPWLGQDREVSTLLQACSAVLPEGSPKPAPRSAPLLCAHLTPALSAPPTSPLECAAAGVWPSCCDPHHAASAT